MKRQIQQSPLKRSLAGMRPASGWETEDPKPDDKSEGEETDDKSSDEAASPNAEDVLYPEDKDTDKEGGDDDAPKESDEKDGGDKDGDKEAAPEKPEDYEIGFPEDLELTDEHGEPLTLSNDDPLVSDIRAAFHEDGLTQTQANRYLGIYGKALKDMGEAAKAMATEAETRELAVLNKDRNEALSRIEKVAASARNILGETEGNALKASLNSGQAVIALEKLLAKVGDEGSGAPPAGGDAGDKTAEQIFYGG